MGRFKNANAGSAAPKDGTESWYVSLRNVTETLCFTDDLSCNSLQLNGSLYRPGFASHEEKKT